MNINRGAMSMAGLRTKLGTGFSAAVAIFLLLAFALACGTTKSYETDKANKNVNAANKNVENYNTIQTSIDAGLAKYNAVPDTSDGAAQALAILNEIETNLNKQISEIDLAIKEFTAAKSLYIAGDFKTYLQMLLDSANKQKESAKVSIQIIQERKKQVQSVVDGSATDATDAAANTAIGTLATQEKKLYDEAVALKEKADKFYKDKNLGGTK
jgi:hypothetical protein